MFREKNVILNIIMFEVSKATNIATATSNMSGRGRLPVHRWRVDKVSDNNTYLIEKTRNAGRRKKRVLPGDVIKICTIDRGRSGQVAS